MHRVAAVLALLLIAKLAVVAPVQAAERLEVKIYHAELGPFIQTLADGRRIMVKIDVYFPDTLVYRGPEEGLGTVNFTITANWTGPWDGIVTVQVVDPGYHIDPTTFKPVESVNAWAEGGDTVGTGALHIASGAYMGSVRNMTVVLRPHERYFTAPSGEYTAQYFFKARLAFFKPDGSKVLGGDVNIYTDSETAPMVKLIVVKEPEAGGDNRLASSIALNAGIAAAVVAIGYAVVEHLVRRKRG
ncbi:MAG TPA: hypothetical protein EYP33_07420 [Pyrodictium sp.]|uniref:Uncharacterized protein n=1 Tax=Pyrodictium delaneyi TaxID=1273541 RepID=A0A833E8R9_9CREN|nr:hypothetical protein [Pyrodictium sp.]HIQ24060.1 hypothetical protein [Pyrodictium delaneyi]